MFVSIVIPLCFLHLLSLIFHACITMQTSSVWQDAFMHSNRIFGNPHHNSNHSAHTAREKLTRTEECFSNILVDRTHEDLIGYVTNIDTEDDMRSCTALLHAGKGLWDAVQHLVILTPRFPNTLDDLSRSRYLNLVPVGTSTKTI